MKRLYYKISTILFCFSAILFVGYLIGFNISDNFLEGFVGKMLSFPSRYSILTITFFLDFIIFKSDYSIEKTFRFQSHFTHYCIHFFHEFVLFIIFFFFFFLPIFLLNIRLFINNGFMMINMYICLVMMSLLIISIVQLFDIKIKNRALSCVLFMGIFAVLDFLTEHYNFFVAKNIIFDFSYIYTIPYHIENPYLFFVLLLLIIFFLNMVFVKLLIKKDYLFNGRSYEES